MQHGSPPVLLCLSANRLAGIGIQDHPPLVTLSVPMPAALFALEIEQTIERTGDLIEGAAFGNSLPRARIYPAETEIVLDEAQNGGLIRHRVVDVIAPRKG